MDSAEIGEANHLGPDALQARKVQVSSPEERKGDQSVPLLSRRYPYAISHSEACELPWKKPLTVP